MLFSSLDVGIVDVLPILLVLVGICIFVFEVWMFISIITNKKITTTARLAWAIGLLLIHPFIAIIYYFTDYKKTK